MVLSLLVSFIGSYWTIQCCIGIEQTDSTKWLKKRRALMESTLALWKWRKTYSKLHFLTLNAAFLRWRWKNFYSMKVFFGSFTYEVTGAAYFFVVKFKLFDQIGVSVGVVLQVTGCLADPENPEMSLVDLENPKFRIIKKPLKYVFLWLSWRPWNLAFPRY